MDRTLNAYFSTALTDVAPPARRVSDETVAVVRDVGGQFGIDLYFPADHTDPIRDAHVTAEEVYRIDRERVKGSDLVFVLAGTPSLGVGQELMMAHASLIPTVLLIPAGTRVSRMALGVPLRMDQVVYDSLPGLRSALDRLLRERLPRIAARRAGTAELDRHHVGEAIRLAREQAGMSQEQLAATIGMTPIGMAALEASTDRQSDPSLTQLRRIAAELGVSVRELV
jgi:DNA-binding XRE family transcriptional regulator